MSKGADLAKQFEAANAAAIQAVEACSDAAWQKTSSVEGWTAAALAHHVAAGYEPIAGFVQLIATGGTPPAMAPEEFDKGNAEHARQFAKANRAETLQLLREGGAKAAATVRALSDQQLDTKSTVFGRAMSAQQATEAILIGHVQEHLASFKKTVG